MLDVDNEISVSGSNVKCKRPIFPSDFAMNDKRHGDEYYSLIKSLKKAELIKRIKTRGNKICNISCDTSTNCSWTFPEPNKFYIPWKDYSNLEFSAEQQKKKWFPTETLPSMELTSSTMRGDSRRHLVSCGNYNYEGLSNISNYNEQSLYNMIKEFVILSEPVDYS